MTISHAGILIGVTSLTALFATIDVGYGYLSSQMNEDDADTAYGKTATYGLGVLAIYGVLSISKILLEAANNNVLFTSSLVVGFCFGCNVAQYFTNKICEPTNDSLLLKLPVFTAVTFGTTAIATGIIYSLASGVSTVVSMARS